MPRKTVFSKQDVIEAACDLVEDRGLHSLTARAVAERLHSSTAPVYSNFKNMEDLSREVIHRGKNLLQTYATSSQTDQVFLNMGVGVIKFARDHGNFYRALFLETNAYKDILTELRSYLLVMMDQDEELAALSRVQKDELLSKMSIFTHGIASQVCVGLLDATRDEDITAMLVDVGASVVHAALATAHAPASQAGSEYPELQATEDNESC